MNYVRGTNQSIGQFLNSVHEEMKTNYNTLRTQDERDAKELQVFFQNLKQDAQLSREGQPINNYLSEVVFQTLQVRHGGRAYQKNLFVRKGGWNLESELAEVIQAVYQASGIKPPVKRSLAIGTTTGTPLEDIIDDKEVQEVLSDFAGKVSWKINSEPFTSLKNFILPKVQIKTDVQGANLLINFQPTTELEKIMVLLDQATFSSKNYKSIGNNQEKLDEAIPNLQLGKSNIYRAFYASLSDAGKNRQTINSAFYKGYYGSQKNGGKEIAAHFYHLRYIYELRGVGIKIKGGKFAPQVKFLVYNDPTGSNIYVESTASILYNILTEITEIDNPFRSVKIAKKFFKNK